MEPTSSRFEEAAMYQLEWLRKHCVIERGHLSANKFPEAVVAARVQSVDIRVRLPLQEPDSFRLLDEKGTELGVFLIDEDKFGPEPTNGKIPHVSPMAWPAC
jgi:hypothetical protein